MSMHRRLHIIALFHLYTHENCHSVFLGPGQLKTVPKVLSCPGIQVKLELWELLQWLFLGKGHKEFPLVLRKSLDLYYQTVSVKTEGVFLFALVTGKLGDKLAIWQLQLYGAKCYSFLLFWILTNIWHLCNLFNLYGMYFWDKFKSSFNEKENNTFLELSNYN